MKTNNIFKVQVELSDYDIEEALFQQENNVTLAFNILKTMINDEKAKHDLFAKVCNISDKETLLKYKQILTGVLEFKV